MRKIPLTNGMEAFVDEIDYHACLEYTWHYGGRGYATTYSGGGKDNQTYTTLHKFVASRIPLIGQIDHKDRNKLNCCRENLRICTTAQNSANREMPSNNTSGVKGVVPFKKNQFQAFIGVNYKKIHLGTFSSLEAAIAARKAAEIQYFGEFAG